MTRKIVALGAASALALTIAWAVPNNTFGGKAVDSRASSSSKKSSDKVAGNYDSCCKNGNTASATASCPESKLASASGCTAGAMKTAGMESGACCKVSKTDADHAALKGIVDELPFREAKRLVVAGSLECGKCNYKVVSTCAPLVKTADGKVYPLLQNDLVHDMRQNKDGEYKMTTNVRKIEGISYLEVKAYTSI